MEADITACLQELTRHKITGMRIRCHGDYHLGQVLYTGSDFVIVDFEGEPMRHLTERRIKRSPLRDVAGMIRSFHYAAYASLRVQMSTILRPEDLPRLEKWAESWYGWVSSTFLKSYHEMIKDAPILPQNHEDIRIFLKAYLLNKALYEINYELNNRPDWINLPIKGIMQLLHQDKETAEYEADTKTEKTSRGITEIQ